MGKQIIKAAPNRDLYMEWSSDVEAPTFLGTRADIAAYLAEPKRGLRETVIADPDAIEQRLQRADLTGSSGYPPFGCDWDDHGEIYKQQGYLPRAKFGEFADRYLAAGEDGEPDITDLLEPLE
jgi:hypothetical protein